MLSEEGKKRVLYHLHELDEISYGLHVSAGPGRGIIGGMKRLRIVSYLKAIANLLEVSFTPLK